LAALVLVIPETRFRSGRHRWLWCTAVVIAALLPSLLWLLAARAAEPTAASPGVDPDQQLFFILRNPISFIGIIFRTLPAAWEGYVVSLVGVLGHVNIPLPGVLYLLYPVALIAAALTDPRDPAELSPMRRTALVGIFAACAGCVLTMAYLGWNPVGRETISGVQGRYFVPALPLLLLAIPAAGLRLPPQSQAWGTAAVAALSLSLAVDSVRRAFFF
jgi:uncharacterized membrane protein